MSFEIIPALDILDGKIVRLVQGQEKLSTEYQRDPLQVLEEFKNAGAQWAHIIDLSGAIRGQRQKLVQEIVKKSPLPVQLGGGLRSKDDVNAARDAGVARVILGTVFLEKPDLGKELVESFGKDFILGAIDIKGKEGKAVGRGWVDSGSVTASEACRAMEYAGVRTVIVTDVDKDGTLEGAQSDRLAFLGGHPTLSFYVAGGIGSLADIQKLSKNVGPQCLGVITGRALYDGRINLAEAVAMVKSGHRNDNAL